MKRFYIFFLLILSLFIGFSAFSAYDLLDPNAAPGLDLKGPKQNIFLNETILNEKKEPIIRYYWTANEASRDINENIDKRTPISQTFDLDNTHHLTRIYSGLAFQKVDNKWFYVNTATTTLEAWNAQAEIGFFKKIKNFFFTSASAVDYYSGSGDGMLRLFGQASWSAVHDATDAYDVGGSTPFYSTVYHLATWTTYRSFFTFDTSAIDDDATIDSASFNFYVRRIMDSEQDMYGYMNIVQTTQANPIQAVIGDYSRWTGVKGGVDIDLGDVVDDSFNQIVFDSDYYDWIDKEGYTKIALLEGHDIENQALDGPGEQENGLEISSSYTYGTEEDPYLDITWSAGEPPVEPPQYTVNTFTNMDIGVISYIATTTLVNASTSVITGTYQIPFLLYFLVLTVLSFAILNVFLFLKLTSKQKWT